jgi:hypothetical protein
VKVSLEGISGASAEGTLQVFAEDRTGLRRPLAVPGAGRSSFASGELFTVEVPEGTRKVAAVLRGKDAGGPLVAVGVVSLP